MINGYLMVIIAMLIWGSIGIFVREINLPSEVIVFFRVFIAGISMIFINGRKLLNERKNITKKEYGLLIVGGVFLALNWLFFFKSLKITTISSATLSYYTAPVLATFIAVFVLKEDLNKRSIIAIVFSFLGIIIMISEPSTLSSNTTAIGILYGIIAAVFYGMVTISGKLLNNVSSLNIVLIQTLVASLIFSPFLKEVQTIQTKDILLLLVVGLVHTSLALTIYFEGIKKIRVQSIGVLSYIDPLNAIVFGFIYFYEIPQISTIIGGLMILISTYIVMKR